MGEWWIAAAAALLPLSAEHSGYLFAASLTSLWRRAIPATARHLEAEFFRAAAATANRGGLRWERLRLGGPLEFARDRPVAG